MNGDQQVHHPVSPKKSVGLPPILYKEGSFFWRLSGYLLVMFIVWATWVSVIRFFVFLAAGSRLS